MTDSQAVFSDPAVEAAFDAFDPAVRDGLLALRHLIIEEAADTPGVGRLEETLKWGQPAYLTPETKSGSTIRLGVPKQGGYAIYAHCQTTILSDFQAIFGGDFDFEGNRAVTFRPDEAPDLEKLRLLIRSALTYHLAKRRP
jgi:hypothetical protein